MKNFSNNIGHQTDDPLACNAMPKPIAPPRHLAPRHLAPRHRATAPPRHRATAPPRHRATAPPRHRATAPPRHRATATSRHPFSTLIRILKLSLNMNYMDMELKTI
jgi:hypothetical protein